MRRLRGRTRPLTAYPADTAIFRRARLRLTAWYVGVLAIIVIGFSVALYTAFAAELPAHQGAGDGSTRQQVEQETNDFALGRLRLLLVAGNIILIAGAAGAAYALAGKTLQPVAAALARQRRFATDASHELRTPLTVIRGTVDVALQRERPAAEYRDVLGEINEEVTALSSLVEQLLQLARGLAPSRLQPPDTGLEPVLDEIVAAYQERYAARGDRLETSVAPELHGRVDAALIRRVAGNLLENALRHTPAGTRVSLTASRHGANVELCVSDSGAGIPPRERERIFEPFYRLQPSTEGAGLGLALVHELVAHAGGSIAVEETQGGGATFRVRLPA